MAPLPSTEGLDTGAAAVLFDLADASIVAGLRGGPPVIPAPIDLPRALQESRGVFVTLTVEGELNGCIGSVQPVEPLGCATARHAWSAAFSDPRLPPLRPSQYDRMAVEVSVLSPLAPLPSGSREDLLAAVRPGVNGVLVVAGEHQAVFLPAVWELLADPDLFLDQLLRKGGLAPGEWPPALRAWGFTASKYFR